MDGLDFYVAFMGAWLITFIAGGLAGWFLFHPDNRRD